MLLRAAQREWNDRVIRKAQSRGYQVYGQVSANKRLGDPSLILTKGRRVLLVWLRTGKRPTASPVPDRFPGVESHLWYPADWPRVVTALELPPLDGPHGDDAA